MASTMSAPSLLGASPKQMLVGASSSASLIWASPVTFDMTRLPSRPSTADPRLALWSRGSDSSALYSIDAPPPTCVKVRSPVHGMITLDGLVEDLTIGELKTLIAERVGLNPARRIHLSTWGREMPDSLTLPECRVKTGSVIDMRLSLVRLDDIVRPTLERVRVLCTCLETRTLPVDRTTTALQLKEQMQAFLTKGEHEWYGKKVISRCMHTRCIHLLAPLASAQRTTNPAIHLLIVRTVLAMAGRAFFRHRHDSPRQCGAEGGREGGHRSIWRRRRARHHCSTCRRGQGQADHRIPGTQGKASADWRQ